MKIVLRIATAALVIAFAGPAFAQGGGGGGGGGGGMDPSKLPKPEEIKKKAKEFLEKAPDATAELEGVLKITYKQVPTDPKKVAEALGKDFKGAGGREQDIEAGLKMYAPQIQEVLNDVLKTAGTFDALVDIKIKSKTIKKGSYKLGLEFDGDRPVALVLNPDDKKPQKISLTGKAVEDQPEVKFEIAQDKKKKEKFIIGLAFVRTLAKSPECEAKPDKNAAKPADGDKKSDDQAKKDSSSKPSGE